MKNAAQNRSPIHDVLLFSWEHERSRRRRKWHAEKRKESVSKDDSEKDSDSPESPPDTTETEEVAVARENLVGLMSEQKKLHKQKVFKRSTFLLLYQFQVE